MADRRAKRRQPVSTITIEYNKADAEAENAIFDEKTLTIKRSHSAIIPTSCDDYERRKQRLHPQPYDREAAVLMDRL